jgi:hypothetical protein
MLGAKWSDLRILLVVCTFSKGILRGLTLVFSREAAPLKQEFFLLSNYQCLQPRYRYRTGW